MTGFGSYDGDDAFIKGDNGTEDGQIIGAVGDRLKVDADVSGTPNGVGSFDSSFRIDYSGDLIDLPNSSNPFATLYSYSGSGLLVGFVMPFNNPNVVVQLVIDSQIIFELDVSTIEDFSSVQTSSARWAAALSYQAASNVFNFNPQVPIRFASNVTIGGRAVNGSTARDMEAYWVSIVKVT